MVEVELRSQQDTSTSRVFKGVVTRPTIATDAPEETRPGGRSGRGKVEGPAGEGRTDVAGGERQEEAGGEGRALLFQRRAFQALVGGF